MENPMRRLAAFLVAPLAAMLLAFGALAQSGDPKASTVSLLPEVVMYATDWCPFCERARQFFKRHDVRYVEHDIEKSPGANAEYRRLGGRGIPLILVGERRVNGFNEPLLREALKEAGYQGRR
jgi:glutaredoxin